MRRSLQHPVLNDLPVNLCVSVGESLTSARKLQADGVLHRVHSRKCLLGRLRVKTFLLSLQYQVLQALSVIEGRLAPVAQLGDEAFPGHQNFANQMKAIMDEGGKIYACRFALQALYGHGEPSLLPGIRPINPLDVLDLVLLHRKDGAFILDTWTL